MHNDKQATLWIDSLEPILITSMETLLIGYPWLPHEVTNKVFLYLHIRLQDENKLPEERDNNVSDADKASVLISNALRHISVIWFLRCVC